MSMITRFQGQNMHWKLIIFGSVGAAGIGILVFMLKDKEKRNSLKKESNGKVIENVKDCTASAEKSSSEKNTESKPDIILSIGDTSSIEKATEDSVMTDGESDIEHLSDDEKTDSGSGEEKESDNTDDETEIEEEEEEEEEEVEEEVKKAKPALSTSTEVQGNDDNNATSSPSDDVQATGILQDENDIVIIPEDSVTVECSEPNFTHPHTGELIPLGCKIETYIEQGDDGYKCAVHIIKEVFPKGLGQECRLRERQCLYEINGVYTEGMNHKMLLNQFEALNIVECTPIYITVKCKYPDKYGNPKDEMNTGKIEFTVTSNDLYVKTFELVPYVGHKVIDLVRRNGKAYQKKTCSIQHKKTEMYVCVTKVNDRTTLTLAPLKRSTCHLSYMFESQVFTGMDKTSTSPFYNKPVVVLAFEDMFKDAITDFIVVTGPSNVGLQPLEELPETVTVLNDKDPRLFYFIETAVNDYFMSVCFTDCYLGYNDSQKLYLQKVSPGTQPKDLYKYEDLQFRISLLKENSDILTESATTTTV